MVRVCQKEFPKGTYKGQRDDGFYMDPLLKENLDILLKNIVDDWDFTIIITGGGEVRIGKSVLAMQIASYWRNQLEELYGKNVPFTIKENMVFDGTRLIEKGNHLGKNYPFSVMMFDEAGADLEGRKIMKSVTQNVLDYYRECGQYNMLNILVLPEFFDLPKGIAMSRSIFLIDTYYSVDQTNKFIRGYFNFYSRRNKKFLYMYGKRELNYNAYRKDFAGRFYEFYPIDEEEYRKVKQEVLEERGRINRDKADIRLEACMYLLNRKVGWTHQQISDELVGLTHIAFDYTTIGKKIVRFAKEKGLDTDIRGRNINLICVEDEGGVGDGDEVNNSKEEEVKTK